MKKLCLILVVLCIAAASVFAFDGYVEVTNNTGFDIYFLYISHEDDEDWGDDVLGDEILEDGSSISIDLEGYSSSIFDIKAEDEDGDTYTVWELDVALEDLDLTLDYLD